MTPDQIELAVEGLMFLKSLPGRLSQNAIKEALAGPILFSSLPELPSWLMVQEYIKRHPEFLNTARLKTTWRKRDRDPSTQMLLIGEFVRRAQGETHQKLYAFAPSVKHVPAIKTVLSEVSDEAIRILNNTTWGKPRKEKMLRNLFSKMEIPGAPACR